MLGQSSDTRGMVTIGRQQSIRTGLKRSRFSRANGDRQGAQAAPPTGSFAHKASIEALECANDPGRRAADSDVGGYGGRPLGDNR